MQTAPVVEKTTEPMMLGDTKQGEEKDNTFLTGTNIEDKLDDSVIDNLQTSQELVEQNLMSNPASKMRRGHQSF